MDIIEIGKKLIIFLAIVYGICFGHYIVKAIRNLQLRNHKNLWEKK